MIPDLNAERMFGLRTQIIKNNFIFVLIYGKAFSMKFGRYLKKSPKDDGVTNNFKIISISRMCSIEKK